MKQGVIVRAPYIDGKPLTDNALLARLLRRGNLWLPDWAESTEVKTNSGATYVQANALRIKTGVTATSTARRHINFTTGWDPGAGGGAITWSKKLTLGFTAMRWGTDAEVIARVQVKVVTTEGILADHGIGLQVDNFALTGESHDGTTRATQDLSQSLTHNESAKIRVEWDGSALAEFFFNNVSKGTITVNLPSGTQGANLVVSIINGATGGTDAILDIGQFFIWQED